MIWNKHPVVHTVPKSWGDPPMIPSNLIESHEDEGMPSDPLNTNTTHFIYRKRWKSIGGSPDGIA